jgi:hypothetical protein
MLWWFVCLLCLLMPAVAHSANTHGNPNIEQNMYWADAFAPYVVTGCLPVVPASGLQLAAFACDAYVLGTSGELLYVTQPAAPVTLTNTAGTHYVAVCRDQSSTIGGWTRQAGTHYIARQAATRPMEPAGCLMLAQATVAGSVITQVTGTFPLGPLPMIDATKHGVMCDGATDDTAALEALLSVPYRVVQLPATRADAPCLIEGLTMTASRVTLQGAGMGQTRLKLKANAAANVPMIEAISQQQLIIRDLELDGDRANQTNVGHAGIQWHDVMDALIERVYVHGVNQHGINLIYSDDLGGTGTGSDGNVIQYNRVEDWGNGVNVGIGINLFKGSERNTVCHNSIRALNNGFIGIQSSDRSASGGSGILPFYNIICNNVIDGQNRLVVGINLVSTQQALVEGNIITDLLGNGVVVSQIDHNGEPQNLSGYHTIRGNHFKGGTGNSLIQIQGQFVVVEGNLMQDYAGRGVYILRDTTTVPIPITPSYITIANNVARNVGSYLGSVAQPFVDIEWGQAITIQGNIVLASDLFVQMVAQDTDLARIVIRHNQATNMGQYAVKMVTLLATDSIENVVIDGNVFTNVSEVVGGVTHGFIYLDEIAGSIGPNIRISNNVFFDSHGASPTSGPGIQLGTGTPSTVLAFGNYESAMRAPYFNPGTFVRGMDLPMAWPQSGTGITWQSFGELRRSTVKVSVGHTAFQAAALTATVNLMQLNPGTRVVAVIADTTTAYAGPAGTLTLEVGNSQPTDPNLYLLAHDVKTAAVVNGLADANLGVGLARASAVQGGELNATNWAGSAFFTATLTSGAGNLSGLTQGATTFYVTVEKVKIP